MQPLAAGNGPATPPGPSRRADRQRVQPHRGGAGGRARSASPRPLRLFSRSEGPSDPGTGPSVFAYYVDEGLRLGRDVRSACPTATAASMSSTDPVCSRAESIAGLGETSASGKRPSCTAPAPTSPSGPCRAVRRNRGLPRRRPRSIPPGWPTTGNCSTNGTQKAITAGPREQLSRDGGARPSHRATLAERRGSRAIAATAAGLL